MPDAQAPDGVLSGSSWMQQPSPWLITLGSQTTLTSTSLPRYVLCAAHTPWTLTLPAARMVLPAANITIKKIGTGSNTVSITPRGTDLIEGISSYRLSAAMDYVTLVSDGISKWYVTLEKGTGPVRVLAGGLGVFGYVPMAPQPARCVTLADVIHILKITGLTGF